MSHKKKVLAGLYDQKPRHKKKIDAKKKTNKILEIFHNRPRVYGINRASWTMTALAKAYERKHGEAISPRTAGRHIRNCGYSVKRSKQILTSTDPNYHDKVELLLKTLHSLKPRETLFFIDEVGPIRVKKHGGIQYSTEGKITTIPQNQKSKGSITLSAALCAKTNQVTWVYEESKDSSAMINLIEILYNQYHNKSKLFITWDAASWHSSHELTDWLDIFNRDTQGVSSSPLIEFVPLPNNSQFLNIIESVFGCMKKAVIHNSNYQSKDEMKTAISLFFKERNDFFKKNPKRAGKKIWNVNFFLDYNNIKSGNYRDY